jgi:glutathione S-transferase
MSCHIALEEAGLSYTAIQLDFAKPDANTAELESLNPLGAAPVLVTGQGKALTQNAAILEYIADQKPESGLLPASGTWERYEAMSWLSFVAADFHKAFTPLFSSKTITGNAGGQEDLKKWCFGNIKDYLKYLDQGLGGKDYLNGKKFTVADAYLFAVGGWCEDVGLKTDEYKNYNSYIARIYQRPAVQKVMKAEGLLR